ncbi:MAG: aldo/keto reductase [Chitinispirillaceae bacterium]|nr:aldo/keto reductase [Chitinispirillaceae bacterium]
MRHRNGRPLDSLGLGCWPLGGDDWGEQDDTQSLSTIRRALELGVTHFDTAQVYGRGHGEAILGEALRNQRYEPFIATKLLYTPKDGVEKALSYSVKRLGCGVIDLVYIHWPKNNADIAGMMEGLEAARRKGILRYIGVSNFSITDMREVMTAGTIDGCQLGYSLLWRKGEKEIIPFCKKNGIMVISYGSLAEGILTGKFGPMVRFPHGDHRERTLLFDQLVWPVVHATVDEMKTIARKSGVTLLQCAIRWLMQEAGIGPVLIGARTPGQVEENTAAAKKNVTAEVLAALTVLSDRLIPSLPDKRNVFGWEP